MDDWTIKTVFDAGGSGLQITRTIHYVNGARYISKNWRIENTKDKTFTEMRFMHGGDTYFAGADEARSYWNQDLGMVYLKNDGISGLMGFYGAPGYKPDGYAAGDYDRGDTLSLYGQLPNETTSAYDDAGYYLQWNRNEMGPGEVWEIKSYEKWTEAADVQVIAPGDISSNPGKEVECSFYVQNFLEAGTFTLKAISAKGWETVCPESIEIDGNSSARVTVAVALPADETAQTDTLTLTATSTAVPTVSNSDNVQITMAPVVHPVLTGIDATEGDNGQKRQLILSGENFSPSAKGNTVRFVSTNRVFDTWNLAGASETQMVVEVPKGAPIDVYHLRVINVNGTSVLSDDTYEVSQSALPLPEVTDVSPVTGQQGKSTTITITGTGFNPDLIGAELFLPGKTVELAGVTFVSSTEVTAEIPAGCAKGVYSIRVKNGDDLFNDVSAVRFEVLPVKDLTGIIENFSSTGIVQLPSDTRIPTNVTLTTDDSTDYAVHDCVLDIEALFEKGLSMEENQGTWNDYAGAINPPRQVPTPDDISEALGDEAVVFTLGGKNLLRFKDGKTVLVKIKVRMPNGTSEPSIYYLPPTGEAELAGIDGEKDGQSYEKGGTVLDTRQDVPEAGYTTYTIGVLLDHMSTYAAGVESESNNSDGSCFIGASSASGGAGKLWATLAALFCFFMAVRITGKNYTRCDRC
ncbi:IPT/TIG domain-containing protein [Desulfoluna sp.]|uniref:IPT/TIG domain-containing protein n=1 Tax=Desulfoluna sp. TaxID=2045199 RepID=UPI0026261E23|nr:IPT/TIG domain-containing protein [Desulfoluna sp.]